MISGIKFTSSKTENLQSIAKSCKKVWKIFDKHVSQIESTITVVKYIRAGIMYMDCQNMLKLSCRLLASTSFKAF